MAFTEAAGRYGDLRVGSKSESRALLLMIHMWTPLWQGPFVGDGLIGCFHMSGLFVRRRV